MSYGGILSPNNEYNIYSTKYSPVSLCPILPVFPDSISYSSTNKSLPLFLVSPKSLFWPLFVRQQSGSGVPVHLVSDTFDIHHVRRYSGDVGWTGLVVVLNWISKSFHNLLMCVLRWCQSWWTHIKNIHLHGIVKQFWMYADRIRNNILRCSSLVSSDCGVRRELGSFHSRRECEPFYNQFHSSSLTLVYHHATILAWKLIARYTLVLYW